MDAKTLIGLIFFSQATACSTSAPTGTAGESKTAIAAACPDAVKATITEKFADLSMTGCKEEHEDGRDQFEVKLARNAGAKLEVDVAADGTIIQTEEQIAIDGVPPKVMAAFTTKYPGANLTRAERQTQPGKSATYELGFTTETKKHEATFAEDGNFLEEE